MRTPESQSQGPRQWRKVKERITLWFLRTVHAALKYVSNLKGNAHGLWRNRMVSSSTKLRVMQFQTKSLSDGSKLIAGSTISIRKW
jgi:hypothetical protein